MKTKFNPENKSVLTYGEALSPAMEITEREDANQYKKAYIEYQERMLIDEPRSDGMTAEQMVNINLGYYVAYYSNETRQRVERLFLCTHPIFGSIAQNGAPTGKQAFEKGLERGQAQ